MQLLNIHQKNETREASKDNRGLDNQGLPQKNIYLHVAQDILSMMKAFRLEVHRSRYMSEDYHNYKVFPC